jgi:hypothetical protein
MTAPKAVREYLAAIGAKGGKVGGKASGPRKNRGPAHYAKMVAVRKAKIKQAQDPAAGTAARSRPAADTPA